MSDFSKYASGQIRLSNEHYRLKDEAEELLDKLPPALKESMNERVGVWPRWLLFKDPIKELTAMVND